MKRDYLGRFKANWFKLSRSRKLYLIGMLVLASLPLVDKAHKALQSPELLARNTFAAVAHADELPAPSREIPILKRIMMAESGGNQFCTAELAKARAFKGCFAGRVGLPLMNNNVDGSTDWGLFQINDWHWGAKAKELGFDIMTEQGNRDMAQWIYENMGTGPWSASKAGWQ
jgi:hypothetical protein